MTVPQQPSVATWTGGRQTMASWARVIDALDQVPEIYRPAYQALVGAEESLPYTVLAPVQGGARSRLSPERLLFELGDRFYALERAGQQVSGTGFRYAEISSLQVSNVLLYSWFCLQGRSVAGGDLSLTVEFNEATLRHFAPFFIRMRPAPNCDDPAALPAEQAKFNRLSKDFFKFMNFSRDVVIPGERVLQFVTQPKIRQKRFALLGRNFYRTASLAHITILTDQEVILIGDGEPILERKGNPYGGVWQYLPLRFLERVELREQPDGLWALTFLGAHGAHAEQLFDAARQPEAAAWKDSLARVLGGSVKLPDESI